ncbi:MAG: helix-turn-helix transcriptional regulator, partial [Bacteroidales bacterium]|nr:helix-turn-helix transcriptional regulator [Bacteroidales bacterium]
KFESDFAVNQQFYKNYLKKLGQEKSTYFASFRSQLPLSDNREILYRFVIGFFFLCVGFILSIYWKSRIRNNKKIESLSVQERKIFNLIRSGMSNKEISDECNIGLSTVKSHLNSIYSKLNIKSRKEAINIKSVRL